MDWNETAKKLGLTNIVNFGVIAQQVKDILPDACLLDEASGYYKVNYCGDFLMTFEEAIIESVRQYYKGIDPENYNETREEDLLNTPASTLIN